MLPRAAKRPWREFRGIMARRMWDHQTHLVWLIASRWHLPKHLKIPHDYAVAQWTARGMI
jgi:hypothetical protein